LESLILENMHLRADDLSILGEFLENCQGLVNLEISGSTGFQKAWTH
jgi:hypothetical protein